MRPHSGKVHFPDVMREFNGAPRLYGRIISGIGAGTEVIDIQMRAGLVYGQIPNKILWRNKFYALFRARFWAGMASSQPCYTPFPNISPQLHPKQLPADPILTS